MNYRSATMRGLLVCLLVSVTSAVPAQLLSQMLGMDRERPVSKFCGSLGVAYNVKSTCSSKAEDFVAASSGLDMAVMGYLCCMGYECLDGQKNLLVYAEMNYILHIALNSKDEKTVRKFADHLNKCGHFKQSIPLSRVQEKKLCEDRKLGKFPTSITQLTTADFAKFEATGSC